MSHNTLWWSTVWAAISSAVPGMAQDGEDAFTKRPLSETQVLVEQDLKAPGLVPRDEFGGQLMFPFGKPGADSIRVLSPKTVLVSKYSLPGNRSAEIAPGKSRVINLVAGDATAVINGTARQMREGEIVTISKRDKVIFRTGDDTALFEVTEVE
ncbi:hypothetical protein NKI48_33855 [Mesorhizobium sp. M0644]|uniref:hypothetical protein n=1 Tax=Mesorhizobium sp. M0644 TaxID=2956979 RepID=UPI003339269C